MSSSRVTLCEFENIESSDVGPGSHPGGLRVCNPDAIAQEPRQYTNGSQKIPQ